MEAIWLQHYDPGIPHTINPDQYRNINEILDKYAQYATQPFLASFNSILSFKEVDSLSKSFAGYLQHELKLKKGDRIAILMSSILQYPVVMFAALRLGLIIVNLPFMLNAHDIQKILKQTEPDTIVVLDVFAAKLTPALKETVVKHVIVTEVGDLFSFFKRILFHHIIKYKKKVPAYDIPGAIPFRSTLSPNGEERFQPVDVEPHDTAFLQFSSAREQALPKCIELSHRNVVANTLQLVAWFHDFFESNPEKTTLQLPPLYRSTPILQLILSFFQGYLNILLADPTNVESVVNACKQHPFSYTGGVQFLFERYLNDPAFAELDFSKFKVCISAGTISSIVSTKWKILTKTNILHAYVVTEATSMICISPYSTKQYHTTIGLPLPSTEIKICDRNGNELPIHHRGELWVRGPQITKGYWRDPERTSQAITADGWFKTGDVCVIDEKGFVTIIERVADLIEFEEKTISPTDIENLITTVKGVAECAVVGIPSKTGRPIIKAYVVRNDPSLTVDTILQTCGKHLRDFQVPDEIIFLEALPRTGVGYIMRRELRERG